MNIGKLIIFPLLTLVLSCQGVQFEVPRERIPLDFDWKFMPGDLKGGEQEDFDDKSWRKMDVPHDWSIEGSYDAKNETGIAGIETCEKTYYTAGEAAQVQLKVDKSLVHANRSAVVHIEAQIADGNGTMLPDTDQLIEFEISGPAKLLGVENGDILDLSPHKVLSRKAFKGKCLLLIQSTGNEGEIEVTARSGNLELARVRILAEGN